MHLDKAVKCVPLSLSLSARSVVRGEQLLSNWMMARTNHSLMILNNSPQSERVGQGMDINVDQKPQQPTKCLPCYFLITDGSEQEL